MADQRPCGSDLLLSLPDDVLFLISSNLRPGDLSALSLCCRRLRAALAESDKAWLAQCLRLLPSDHLLSLWRPALPSYRHLCRFLSSVSPLLGLWVHQNPELGNVVFVSWGPHFSVLDCRVIPQELSPHLLWAPVFEITPDPDGAQRCFFLHGRDRDHPSLYPSSVVSIHPNYNVLLLEVDTRRQEISRSTNYPQFSKLAFGDRRGLLDVVANRVQQRISPDLESVPLFATNPEEEMMLADRRSRLVQTYMVSGGGRVDWPAPGIWGSIEQSRGHSGSNGDGVGCGNSNRGGSNGKKRSFFSVVRQIMGRSTSPMKGPSLAASDTKHVPLSDFFRAGDTVGLTLRATNMRLTTYRAWPNMHDNRFALYKLPSQEPTAGKEYAGLWGGTFGWPPGKTSVDKPGKALFFLLLSYEETEGHILLIATKILEGTHYVLHPNGSAMFIVKVEEPALETFPLETDEDGV